MMKVTSYRISAAERPRSVGSKTLDTPWMGTFSDYQTLGGYRIPTSAEVSWDFDNQTFSYWRGQVTALEVEEVS